MISQVALERTARGVDAQMDEQGPTAALAHAGVHPEGAIAIAERAAERLAPLVDEQTREVLATCVLAGIVIGVRAGTRDALQEIDVASGSHRCRVCGCTDHVACDDVCFWAEDNLCSTCAGEIRTALACLAPAEAPAP